MWRHFRLSLALVTTNNVIVIYWKPLVGIDSDTEETLISYHHLRRSEYHHIIPKVKRLTRIGVDQKSNVTF